MSLFVSYHSPGAPFGPAPPAMPPSAYAPQSGKGSQIEDLAFALLNNPLLGQRVSGRLPDSPQCPLPFRLLRFGNGCIISLVLG